MRKLCIIFMTLILLQPLSITNKSFAESLITYMNEEVVLFSSEKEIHLYETIEDIDSILTIPNNTLVQLQYEENEEFSFIQYTDSQGVITEGYVQNEFIVQDDSEMNDSEKEKEKTEVIEEAEVNLVEEKEKAEVDSNVKLEEPEKINQPKKVNLQLMNVNVKVSKGERYEGTAVKDKTYVYESQSRSSKQLKSYAKGSRLVFHQIVNNTSWYVATVYLNGKAHTGYIHKDDVSVVLQGYGQLEPTNVYAQTNKNSAVLKSYRAGHLLKYRPYNNTWYEATVIINGKAQKGYINKGDVGQSKPILYGYAQLERTSVYAQTNKSAKVLRSYQAGHLLKYRPYNNTWYEATVIINGKAQTGYIYKDDVGENKPTLYGYAQLEPTNVYAQTSKESEILRNYKVGHLLKYRPYNDTWYEATVIINGTAQTGYIYKQDVGENKPSYSGYAQLNPTNVYAQTNKGSSVLRSYKIGHLLKYRPYNNTWYEATVIINGKAQTGYIYKDDVGENKPSLNGYAQQEPTNVYANMNKSSNVLKSYRAGHLLKYRPYNNTWYEATVIINGKAQTGYIYGKDVGDNIPSIKGLAVKNPTSVYSGTSRNSSILKSYRKGQLLKYRPHNNTWYKATVYVNGIARTGYIHRSDVMSSNGRTVMIDAGHGGHDPGAGGNGLREKDLTLKLALKTQRMLEDAGFNVIMTRTTDKYLTLEERSKLANSSKVDIFVSIHINSGGGTGIETYWYDKYESNKSNALATSIQNEVIKETGERNRGVKKGNFHVVRETQMPSALVEVGFIDNASDAQKLKQESFLNKAVKGIVSGIKKFFGLF